VFSVVIVDHQCWHTNCVYRQTDVIHPSIRKVIFGFSLPVWFRKFAGYLAKLITKVWDSDIYDRLRPVSGLKSACTPQIGIHWHHYLKTRSDLRVFWNLCPFQILRSMANLLVSIRAYDSDVIGCWFEKVRNGHRFEGWMPIWEF
jgi:hypothetical protein